METRTEHFREVDPGRSRTVLVLATPSFLGRRREFRVRIPLGGTSLCSMRNNISEEACDQYCIMPALHSLRFNGSNTSLQLT